MIVNIKKMRRNEVADFYGSKWESSIASRVAGTEIVNKPMMLVPAFAGICQRPMMKFMKLNVI